jgi:hypothetical protein
MGLIKKFKEITGVINIGKSIASEFMRLKQAVLTYNSQADVEWEKTNPVPAATEPDYKQVFYYQKRSWKLLVEMLSNVGKQLKE